MARWNDKTGVIITMVVALIMVGVLLPIALADLVDYSGSYNVTVNGTAGEYNTGTNSTVGTLVSTIIPVMIVIVLILGFLSYTNKK